MRDTQSAPQIDWLLPEQEVPSSGRWGNVMGALALAPTAHNLPTTVPERLLAEHSRTLLVADKHRLPLMFVGYGPAFSGVKFFRRPGTDWVLMNVTEDPLYYKAGEKILMPPHVIKVFNDITEVVRFDRYYIAHEIPHGVAENNHEQLLRALLPPPPPATMQNIQALERGTDAVYRCLALPTGVVLDNAGSLASAAGNIAVSWPKTLINALRAIFLGVKETRENVAETAKHVKVNTEQRIAQIKEQRRQAAEAREIVKERRRRAREEARQRQLASASYDPILFGLFIDDSTTIEGEPLALWYYLTHWYWHTNEQ